MSTDGQNPRLKPTGSDLGIGDTSFSSDVVGAFGDPKRKSGSRNRQTHHVERAVRQAAEVRAMVRVAQGCRCSHASSCIVRGASGGRKREKWRAEFGAGHGRGVGANSYGRRQRGGAREHAAQIIASAGHRCTRAVVGNMEVADDCAANIVRDTGRARVLVGRGSGCDG